MSDGIQAAGGRSWHRAGWVLLGVLIVLGMWTVSDYGMTWDEHFRFKGGDAKLDYYQDLFAGRTAEAPNDSYPGLFDLPLALVHEMFPEWGTRSEKGHVYSMLFGWLGLLSVWRLTARIGGERAGFWGLLFLATLPRFYGHMYFNPKDIPLAGTYAAGLWALVALFSRMPKPGWRFVGAVGLAAGLAMSTRIAGFLILVYWGVFVGLYLGADHLVRWRESGETPEDAGRAESFNFGRFWRDLRYWGLRGLAGGAIGFAILFVFWPALHVNPLASAGAAAETVQRYGWDGMVLMDGHFWEAKDLPFYYIPYWLFFTVPEHVQVLAGLGLVLGVGVCWERLRGRRKRLGDWFWPGSVVACGGLFPIGYLLWKDPVLYDGMRHILFALVPFVCVAALALEWLIRWVERWRKPLPARALQIGVGAAAGIVAVEMASLHPYQYVYFNQISGGLPGAYNRDETDYWGLSHKEAAEWLNDYAEMIDPEGEQVFKVHQRYSRWMLKEHLDPGRFEMTPEREGADFFVSVTRFNLHTSYPEAEVLHVVERQGAPLCFVYQFHDGLTE